MGIRLIVGLGNPGGKYADTRHNAGFWLIDAVARMHRGSLRPESKFQGDTGKVLLAGEAVWLLQPQTFMNHSGRSVAALAHFYRLAPEEILVAHDELDLPPGTVRIKKGGGHAGHNGLKDIDACLGSKDYWRLRLGIGHPGDRSRVADYVLHPPGRDEDAAVRQSIDRSLEVLPLMVEDAFPAAMQKLHAPA